MGLYEEECTMSTYCRRYPPTFWYPWYEMGIRRFQNPDGSLTQKEKKILW